MNIFETLDAVDDRYRNCVVAIGNFDGIHLGHQALLRRAKSRASALGVPVVVLTFEPHPRALFRPDDPPARLTPFPVKVMRLAGYQIDALVSLNFNWDFASQSADHFIQTILKDGLRAAHIVVGYDFRFGQLRVGTPRTLEAAGFSVDVIEEIADEGAGRYSSSQIRQLIRHGDMKAANAMLGWEWYLQGVVEKGDQRGRDLGYPTANVPLSDTVHPCYGVWAAYVDIDGDEIWRKAAVNIGIRPMFELDQGRVEAHILDFDGDLYGKILRGKLVQRLRGEAKFETLDALILQMEKDCLEAASLL